MQKHHLIGLFVSVCISTLAQVPNNDVIRSFVEDVCCRPKEVVRRWPAPPAVSIFNDTSVSEAETMCQNTITEINEALAPVPFQLSLMAPKQVAAPFRVVIVERKDFIAAVKKHGVQPIGTRTWGWWQWWDGQDNLTRTLIILSIEQGDEARFQEEAASALMFGMGFTYSAAPIPSLLGPVAKEPRTGLTDLDKLLLPFFYTHVPPGSKAYEVRRAFDRNWK